MGGGRKQYQVLVNPNALRNYGVTLHEVERAMAASNANATGGYLNRGAREYLVRSIGRLQSVEDIENVVVKADSRTAGAAAARWPASSRPRRCGAAIRPSTARRR